MKDSIKSYFQSYKFVEAFLNLFDSADICLKDANELAWDLTKLGIQLDADNNKSFDPNVRYI